MASRHMNYLRKHQKVILAILGVVCMITFVLGQFLMDLLASAGGAGGPATNPVVVTWVGGKVRQDDLRLKQQTHQVAVNFLRMLILQSVERGGQPVVNGQAVTKEMGPPEDPGIPGDSGEATIVRTMLLAKKADEMGIVVDREAARDFVLAMSFPDVTEAEWPAILAKAAPNLPMSVDQLLDQLAFDLKATHARVLSQAGLFGLPPGQVWEYHNRLNRRFAIEAYPVEVAPFAGQVQEEPKREELLALFEKGKANDPDPSLADPGFKVPHKLAFQWLKIEFKPFLDAALPKITDEQVAKQYELDITQGKHKVIELPMDPAKPAESAKPADAPATTDPAAKPADKPTDEKPGEEKPAADKPAADKPAEDKPAEDKPAADKTEEKPAEKPAAEGDQKPCAQEQPATEGAKTDEAQPAETKPTEVKPGETPPAATTPPATTPPATTPAAAPPPKFKPLEEVKEGIRESLAQPIAQEAMKAAVEKAVAEVNQFGRKFRRWKDSQEASKQGVKVTKAEDPGQLDLAGIAAKHGFKSGSTELVDRFEIAEIEIGQKVMEFDMQAIRMGQFRQLSFADMAFGTSDVLYAPNTQPVNSTDPDVSYIYWRTAEQEAKDPTFEEVQKQLVEAWKLDKAFALAKVEAQKLADKAKTAKDLKEAVPDPTKVVTPGPFSWLTTGSLAFGSGAPSLSTPTGIELAGTDFMEAVFSLKPGKTGIAPNQSHRKIYVVKVMSQEPGDDVLKEQFLESGLNMPVMNIAQREMMRTSIDLFEGLDKEMQLVWVRPPIIDR